jgi:flagellar basal body-associated protein FliL
VRVGNSRRMSLITILLIVLIVMLLFGGLGYRRRL